MSNSIMGGGGGGGMSPMMFLLLQQQAKQQQEAKSLADIAAQKQETSIQQGLSAETAALLRDFGAKQAMAGSNISPPLSLKSGGFANPVVTGTGALKAA